MKHNTWFAIPGFVWDGLTQNVKMDNKMTYHRSLKTMQLLPMSRCKYTSKADMESRDLYNLYETLMVFEDPEVRDRMRNKGEIEMLTNACFLAINHTEGLMNVEQSIKSKMAQAITSENKAVVILDHPRNRSKAFDIQIAEPMFEFHISLPITVAIDTSQWKCCLGNMANVLHLMGDTESEDFFRMNMDKDWSWFHQMLVKKTNILFCKNTNIFHIMQTVLIHLFDYSIFSFRKLTYDELKVIAREYQLLMILVLQHVHHETQKQVKYFQVLNAMGLFIWLMEHIQNA